MVAKQMFVFFMICVPDTVWILRAIGLAGFGLARLYCILRVFGSKIKQPTLNKGFIQGFKRAPKKAINYIPSIKVRPNIYNFYQESLQYLVKYPRGIHVYQH